jgi:hypothetical protein
MMGRWTGEGEGEGVGVIRMIGIMGATEVATERKMNIWVIDENSQKVGEEMGIGKSAKSFAELSMVSIWREVRGVILRGLENVSPAKMWI